MGHGFFVIPVAAILAWKRKERLKAIPPRPSWWGLLLISLAALQLLIATLGVEQFLARTALIVSIAGAVLLLFGFEYLRVMAFPIALLFLMVPLPSIIYNQATLPLQLLASAAGEFLLRLFGYHVERLGNIIIVSGHELLVSEACSGIRSLLTLAFISLVYGAFVETSLTIRTLLFAATLPIALASNAVRVALTGVLANINPKYAEGFTHEATGWVIFVVSTLLTIGTHAVLQRFRRPRRAS